MTSAQPHAKETPPQPRGRRAVWEASTPASRGAAAGSAALCRLNYDPALSPMQLFEAHRAWAEQHARPLYPGAASFETERDPERPLRVGYVSPDLRRHPVAFFVEPILRSHDSQQVTAVCYDVGAAEAGDDMAQHLRSLVPSWRVVTEQTDHALAETIRADRIDILVDLAGHTPGNRLLTFARRPAPIQVTAIGYVGTTGLATMDYRLTDPWCDPAGAERGYSEALWRLEGGFNCYAPPQGLPEPGPPPYRTAGSITFGSFNNLDKISPEVLDIWGRILARVPASRLLLKTKTLSQDRVRQAVLQCLASHDIAPERVEMIEWSDTLRQHFEGYRRLDVALDPFPYNGTTTTCEALMMGVPVIALAGDRHAARVSASLLARLELPVLIAASPVDYVERAVALAAHEPALNNLRASLRRRLITSPICDAAGYTRALEAAYRAMWRNWCAVS
jgi:predicted O-linked N-acetylglucosamine transferase (SPINDLY family)